MKRILSIIFVLLFGEVSYSQAFEVSTHRILNEAATAVSILDSYTKTNLDFPDGTSQIIGNQTIGKQKVVDWIKTGGEFEDHGYWYLPNGFTRYINHFHNPLKPWDQAGLNDIRTGMSSLLWAQLPANTQQTFGNWSWHDARNYFYRALTSEELTTRDQAFANMFQAVGQVMHLVEDVSVPAHTRNDAHILYNYEKWVRANEKILNMTPIIPNVSLSVSIEGKVPITQFWDTNQYDGTMPLTGTDIGLAEYSNANFLSEETIFQNATNNLHYFPYPAKSLMELWTDPANNRQYLRNFEHGELLQHMAAVSFLYWYRLRYFPEQNGFLPLALDDATYNEQADKLVPRAVGYSAGLLNYFFRGQLDAKFSGNDGIYITNKTSESMNGAFRLYYDAMDGQRKPATDDPWSLSLVAGAVSTRQTFTPPSDVQNPAIYTLVFQGQMGAEEGAVAGKILRSEANHLFIIEETAEVLDPPVIRIPFPEEKFWSWDYVAGPEATQVGHPRQRISGKFVLHGSAYIERIAAVGLDGPAKVYLDGVLIDPSTWTGNPLHIPQTWAIEPDTTQSPSVGSGGPNSLQAVFLVQLSDGKVFDGPLIGFLSVRFISGTGQSCATPCITPTYYYTTGLGQIELSIRSSYSVLSVGGHPIDQEKLRSSIYGYYCEPPEPLNHLSLGFVTIPLDQYCYGSAIDGSMNGFVLFRQTGYVTSDPGIDYFNSSDLTISTQVQYQTPPDEVERLRAIGLEPNNLTVTLH